MIMVIVSDFMGFLTLSTVSADEVWIVAHAVELPLVVAFGHCLTEREIVRVNCAIVTNEEVQHHRLSSVILIQEVSNRGSEWIGVVHISSKGDEKRDQHRERYVHGDSDVEMDWERSLDLLCCSTRRVRLLCVSAQSP